MMLSLIHQQLLQCPDNTYFIIGPCHGAAVLASWHVLFIRVRGIELNQESGWSRSAYKQESLWPIRSALAHAATVLGRLDVLLLSTIYLDLVRARMRMCVL